MGLFSSKTPAQKAEIKQATAKLRKAQAALDANGVKERKAGIRDETDTYLALNAVVERAYEAQKRAKRGR